MTGLEMSVVPYESYKEAEREVQRLREENAGLLSSLGDADDTASGFCREIQGLRQTVIKLEEEVSQLREMAKDLYDWCPACLGCHPSREWMCPMCKHRKVIEGWEAVQ